GAGQRPARRRRGRRGVPDSGGRIARLGGRAGMTATHPPREATPETQAPLLEQHAPADGGVVVVLAQVAPRLGDVAANLRGRLVHVHRKVYLPTYGLFDEQRYFAPGERFRTFEAPLPAAAQRRPWQAGVLICEDMWHLTAPALLARQGLELLLCPSSSPGRGI